VTDHGARVGNAIERIAGWLNAHGAPLLVENLASGASAETLAHAADELGAPLPPDLVALWSHHDGQREELNGFIASLDLLGTRRSLSERPRILASVTFLRETPETWDAAGVTTAELQSDLWLPIASRDHDSIVVSGISGRVFSCRVDSPPLSLLAASVADWLDAYADRVVAGHYAIEAGFGTYYLAAGAGEADDDDDEDEEDEPDPRGTPLLDRLREAIATKNAETCSEVLRAAFLPDHDLEEEAAAAAQRELVELLFATNPEPRFVASALRRYLSAVDLSREQWQTIATGGELLGNNAIRAFAAARATR